MIADLFAKRPLTKVIYALSKDLSERYADGFVRHALRQPDPGGVAVRRPRRRAALRC